MKRGASGGGKPRAGRKGPLTEEDHELWQLTAATLDPLRRVKPRVPAATSQQDATPTRPRAQPLIAPAAPATKPPRAADYQAPVVGPERSGPPPLADFERRHARRIAKGQIAIDARLDLHGARQSEAYVRFRAFVLELCGTRLVDGARRHRQRRHARQGRHQP